MTEQEILSNEVATLRASIIAQGAALGVPDNDTGVPTTQDLSSASYTDPGTGLAGAEAQLSDAANQLNSAAASIQAIVDEARATDPNIPTLGVAQFTPPSPVVPPAPVSSPMLAVTDASGSHSVAMDSYTGPVDYLQDQYIADTSNGFSALSSTPNVFLHGGSGDDALQVTSGHNVLDGGTGSNFLVGTAVGQGTDTFFTDARNLGGASVWSTLVNFHQGDMATLWGFTPGDAMQWVDNEGADGSKGLTLHVDTAGRGVDVSMTFAGLSTADMSSLAVTTGGSGSGAYLAITHL